jgi:hypothetical protein
VVFKAPCISRRPAIQTPARVQGCAGSCWPRSGFHRGFPLDLLTRRRSAKKPDGDEVGSLPQCQLEDEANAKNGLCEARPLPVKAGTNCTLFFRD